MIQHFGLDVLKSERACVESIPSLSAITDHTPVKYMNVEPFDIRTLIRCWLLISNGLAVKDLLSPVRPALRR